MTGALPEWAIVARTDKDSSEHATEALAGCWTTVPTMALRGSAHTNFERRSMSIPVGTDARSKAVRGHELLHARMSPYTLHPEVLAHWGVSLQAVMVAEELRVNTTLKRSDMFDHKQLKDGSELNHAKSIASGGADFFYEAVLQLVSVMNTGSEASVYKELKAAFPLLEDIRKTLRAMIKSTGRITSTIPSTVRLDNGEEYIYPWGFKVFTVPVAEVIDRFRRNEGETPEGYEQRLNGEARRVKPGESAALWIATPPLTENGRNFLSRTRRASSAGRLPKRLHRMLTDPERRIFDRVERQQGGIVVIDCSGSMQLDSQEVKEIVRYASGCTVIAYSHMGAGRPNAWILAQDGAVISEADMPEMGKGNGVDEPVLAWAIKNRKKPSDPIVWVCDGHVTDCNDESSITVREACSKLAVEGKVRQVPDVQRAIRLLRDWSNGKKAPPSLYGLVAKWATFYGLVSATEETKNGEFIYYDVLDLEATTSKKTP